MDIEKLHAELEQNEMEEKTTVYPLVSFEQEDVRVQERIHSKKLKRKNKQLSQMLMVSMLSATIGASSAYFLAEYRFKQQGSPLFAPQISTEQKTSSTISSEVTYQNVGGALTPAEISKIASPAVLAIHTSKEVRNFFGTSVATGSGSGVIIHPEGYVATNYHVIEGAETVELTLSDGKKYKAKLVGSDETTDLALLKIESQGEVFPYLELADSSKAQVGEQVVAIGNPLGQLEGSLTVGYISAIERNVEINQSTGNKTLLQGLIQTDAAINRGNSGGALINQEGKLLGINTLKTLAVGVEGIGFAIPSNTFKPILEELKTYGKVTSRPIFGISAQNIGEEVASRYGLPQGVWVTSVLENGPAFKAGLKTQDIIIEIDGEKIQSTDQLKKILLEKKIGDVIKVKYVRQSEELETDLTLGEDPKFS